MGHITCEAGTLLRDIQRLCGPHGWLLPVVPGTQLITVGGAIANDVHGKNQHVFGSFGHHVRTLELLRSDGSHVTCSPTENEPLFRATIGGMGLTGIITSAQLQLKRVPSLWLEVESIPYQTFEEFFLLSDTSQADWEHIASWVNGNHLPQCNGLFLRARSWPYTPQTMRVKRGINIPYTPPVSLINRPSIWAFNKMYSLVKCRPSRKIMFYEHFLFPLDGLNNWNRLYGPKGFYQYQVVIPYANRITALQALFQTIAHDGQTSFLNVLKMFGTHAPAGLMSFPTHGITFSMDFPNLGAKTHTLFHKLDAIVHESGGRLYPAKDARMPASLFQAGYPNLSTFLTYRDPHMRSGLSHRLIDEPHYFTQ